MSCMWYGCDEWYYAFILDAFTRQWLGFVFDTHAARRTGHANHKRRGCAPLDPSRLAIRVGSDSQYAGRDFGGSVSALGGNPSAHNVHTPQQNGHIESFHNTPKRECVWPRELWDAEEAEVAPFKALADCNRNRIRSAIWYVTSDGSAMRRGNETSQKVVDRS